MMLLLSSIIEKETSISHERFKVAGVFINRLKRMRLQSDPTVIFAMTKGERKFDRKLLRKDLKYDSDYNTYVTNGLPPSPISFPGLESLNAALNQKKIIIIILMLTLKLMDTFSQKNIINI